MGPFRPDVALGQTEGGRTWLRGDQVLFDGRFKAQRWDRCPIALIGDKDCPAPQARLNFIGDTFDAAAMFRGGGDVHLVEESPTPALVEGMLHVSRQWDLIEVKKNRDKARQR